VCCEGRGVEGLEAVVSHFDSSWRLLLSVEQVNRPSGGEDVVVSSIGLSRSS
jgi:hypothetical protein